MELSPDDDDVVVSHAVQRPLVPTLGSALTAYAPLGKWLDLKTRRFDGVSTVLAGDRLGECLTELGPTPDQANDFAQ